MARLSKSALFAPFRRLTPGRSGTAVGALVGALLLSGCAVDVQNRPPVYRPGYDVVPAYNDEAARRPRPRDTVYTGWRVFQDRCAACHGPDARGSYRAPDLMPPMRTMDSRRFITHVLYRYEWGIPAQRGNPDALDALIEDIEKRRQGELTMPAFQGEPRVTAHIADLYSYLAARADGSLRSGRPR